MAERLAAVPPASATWPRAAAYLGADLVVCSCVLSQLYRPHLVSAERALALRSAELGARARVLLRAELGALSLRLQDGLVARVAAEAVPGGILYLSDTMEVAPFTTRAGGWDACRSLPFTAPGSLAARLGRGYEILARADWTWVNAPTSPGGRGTLWRIEALTTRRA